MTTFKNLAHAVMHAGGLDLGQTRRLIFYWQGHVTPGAERISTADFDRLLAGDSVPDHGEEFAHAALVSLLPASLPVVPIFGPDKVLNILRNYASIEERSPFALVRSWSAMPNGLLAAELGMSPGRLRELCRASWCWNSAEPAFIPELATLGRWFGSNAAGGACGKAA